MTTLSAISHDGSHEEFVVTGYTVPEVLEGIAAVRKRNAHLRVSFRGPFMEKQGDVTKLKAVGWGVGHQGGSV